MNGLSVFRGASGEVVRGFLAFGTLLTVFPVIVATLILATLAGLVIHWTEPPVWISLPLLSIATSPVTGLFAVAARTGDLTAGFMDCLMGHLGRVPGFVVRHGVLSLLWGVPLGLAAEHVPERMARSFESGFAPGSVMGAGVAVALFILVVLLAPTLSLLVATRTDQVSDLLAPWPWRWLLLERRRDLPVFFASITGALVLFLLVAYPVSALVVALVARTSGELGVLAAGVAYVVPLAATPVLLGRMAGAFATSDYMDLGEGAGRPPLSPGTPVKIAPRAAATSPSATPPPAASGPPATRTVALSSPVVPVGASSPMGAPAVGPALQQVQHRAEHDLPGAIELARRLCASHPRNPAAAHALAGLLRRAGRDVEATDMTATTIRLALQQAAGPIACDAFRSTSSASEAEALGLLGSELLHLARYLEGRGESASAAWCLEAALRAGADRAAVDRGLFGLAEALAKAGKLDQALRLYEQVAQRPGSSPVTGHAREAAARTRRRLETGA